MYMCVTVKRISPTGDRRQQFMTSDTYRVRFSEAHLDKMGMGSNIPKDNGLK